MAYQSVFERYEIKYLLTDRQKERILQAIEPYMVLDRYGRTTIRNLYFDTDTYRLIRRSVEKPVYKEKLRVRSYACAAPESMVFVELKKKYRDTVYKRRISLPEAEAMRWVTGAKHCRADTQITHEIDYALEYYGGLSPKVFISYAREAYCERGGGDFRVTFDDTLLARRENLSLASAIYGTPLLGAGQVLMEIKCAGGMPLWMVQVLSEEHIYKTSFSKYGTAYQNIIFPQLNLPKGGVLYVS